MAVLALEASTSSAKAMLFEPKSGEILRVAGRAYPPEICDTVTMDAPGAVDFVLSLGREILNGSQNIEMVVLSSIWFHSGGLFDANMAPIGRLRTWADPSGSGISGSLRKNPELYDRLYSLTGNPPHSIYALYKWLELASSAGMDIGRVPHLMALPDYLFYRFTGKRMVSSMTASASGLMNIHKLKWDDEIMKRFGITEPQLSVIVPPEHTEPLNKVSAEALGLDEGIPVLIVGADGACNQIAVGGLKPGIMSVSVGTSAALRLSSASPSISKGEDKNWCYYGAEGRWICGAATNGAGSCLDWFSKKLCGGTPLSELDLELSNVYSGPMEAPVFLPFLFGERCPGWQDKRTGGWQELSGAHSRTALYYSVLEGVLFNMYQCYLALCGDNPPEHILISGGIVRSSVWLQMAADIFKMPMEVVSVEHASLLGALRIAQKLLGYTKSLTEVSCSILRTVYPNSSSGFDRRFSQYMSWYRHTR
ncbi:MAG: gluconokinase [Oscillospiraceae bacterium]